MNEMNCKRRHEIMENTQPVAVLDGDTLRDLVCEGVEEALAEALPAAIREAMAKPYLTKQEVMQLTGWSARTVEYRKSNGEIPFIKRKRTVLFPREELMEYLEEGRVHAKS